MNHPAWHWALAGAALVAGYAAYGWPGVALAVTAIVFWLLLQFNRAVRVMRSAGAAPIGRIDSAVMLNAKLRPGLVMIDVLKLTRSLGERQADGPEVWRWVDEGGSAVRLSFENGCLATWALERPSEAA